MDTPWKRYKEKNGVTPFDLLKPNAPSASEEDYNDRLSICKSCPELIQLTTQCKKCGCNMYFKARLQEAKCPLGKW
jgi:hypothetical protein